jgi:hypothetical protein
VEVEAAPDSRDKPDPRLRDRVQAEEAEAEGVVLVQVVQDPMPVGKVARPKTASVQREERVVQTEAPALIREDLVAVLVNLDSRHPAEITHLEQLQVRG